MPAARGSPTDLRRLSACSTATRRCGACSWWPSATTSFPEPSAAQISQCSYPHRSSCSPSDRGPSGENAGLAPQPQQTPFAGGRTLASACANWTNSDPSLVDHAYRCRAVFAGPARSPGICFCLFVADSMSAVEQVNDRLRVPSVRMTGALIASAPSASCISAHPRDRREQREGGALYWPWWLDHPDLVGKLRGEDGKP